MENDHLKIIAELLRLREKEAQRNIPDTSFLKEAISEYNDSVKHGDRKTRKKEACSET